ncbi:hypothetical protein MPLB_950015 [Mesorhizobium sp. ORS 3324]|nr:hypothetical protein MPLB_950015 [Mesorhizobium sp. ORS 3324]
MLMGSIAPAGLGGLPRRPASYRNANLLPRMAGKAFVITFDIARYRRVADIAAYGPVPCSCRAYARAP